MAGREPSPPHPFEGSFGAWSAGRSCGVRSPVRLWSVLGGSLEPHSSSTPSGAPLRSEFPGQGNAPAQVSSWRDRVCPEAQLGSRSPIDRQLRRAVTLCVAPERVAVDRRVDLEACLSPSSPSHTARSRECPAPLDTSWSDAGTGSPAASPLGLCRGRLELTAGMGFECGAAQTCATSDRSWEFASTLSASSQKSL
jgi:hypothetical protein